MLTKREQARQARRAALITRWVAVSGAVPVLIVALWVSYWHIHDVTVTAGESGTTAAIMALSVDGLMIVSGLAIVANRKTRLPYVAFGIGVTASLAANVVSADGTALSYIVAGWPAIALTITSELLLRLLVPRPTRGHKPRRRAVAKTVPAVNGRKRTIGKMEPVVMH